MIETIKRFRSEKFKNIARRMIIKQAETTLEAVKQMKKSGFMPEKQADEKIKQLEEELAIAKKEVGEHNDQKV